MTLGEQARSPGQSGDFMGGVSGMFPREEQYSMSQGLHTALVESLKSCLNDFLNNSVTSVGKCLILVQEQAFSCSHAESPGLFLNFGK